MLSRLIAPVFLFFALALGGCATRQAQQAQVPQPAPCSDSLYLQLKRAHPDSLSERAWQRLQNLDQACAATKTQATKTEATGQMSGMMGMGSGRGVLLMGAVMVVGLVMVLTMGALR